MMLNDLPTAQQQQQQDEVLAANYVPTLSENSSTITNELIQPSRESNNQQVHSFETSNISAQDTILVAPITTPTSNSSSTAASSPPDEFGIDLVKTEPHLVADQQQSLAASSLGNNLGYSLNFNNPGDSLSAKFTQNIAMIPTAHGSDHQFGHHHLVQQQQQQQQQQPQHLQNNHYSLPASKILSDSGSTSMALNFSHDLLNQHAAVAVANLHHSVSASTSSSSSSLTPTTSSSNNDNLTSPTIDVKSTVPQLAVGNTFVDLNPNNLMQTAAAATVSMNMWKSTMGLNHFKHPGFTDPNNFLPNTDTLNTFSSWHHGSHHLGQHQTQLSGSSHNPNQHHTHNQSSTSTSSHQNHLDHQHSNNQSGNNLNSTHHSSLDGQQLINSYNSHHNHHHHHHNQATRSSLPVLSGHELLGNTSKHATLTNTSVTLANAGSALSSSVEHTSFVLNHQQAATSQNSSSTQPIDNQLNNLRSHNLMDHHHHNAAASAYNHHDNHQFYTTNNDSSSRSENRSLHDRASSMHMSTSQQLHQGQSSNYHQHHNQQVASLLPQTSGSHPIAGSSSGSSSKNTSFRCPTCSEVFPLRTVYQSHLKTHSQDKGTKTKFSCELCGHSFSQKTSLNRHMKSHTGERPFPCEICGKAFSEKERLKIHMRTHTGEKPFSCNICGKSFSQKSTVKRHQTVHTGEKKFRCDCGKGFANRGNLIAHIKTRGTH